MVDNCHFTCDVLINLSNLYIQINISLAGRQGRTGPRRPIASHIRLRSRAGAAGSDRCRACWPALRSSLRHREAAGAGAQVSGTRPSSREGVKLALCGFEARDAAVHQVVALGGRCCRRGGVLADVVLHCRQSRCHEGLSRLGTASVGEASSDRPCCTTARVARFGTWASPIPSCNSTRLVRRIRAGIAQDVTGIGRGIAAVP